MVLERRIFITSSDAMEVLFSLSGNSPGNILKDSFVSVLDTS
jgi:hypothetical protein